MSEKVIGRIYTKHRFEALIRDKTEDCDIITKDVFVEYPSNVIYVAGGEEKIGTMQTMTDGELWSAAIANVQHMTAYGETGELLALRKKEMEIERRMYENRQRTIFDAIEDERDKMTDELHAEASEHYDNMIR